MTAMTHHGSALPLLALLSAGCLPFVGNKGEPPRTSLAIQRFATAASALGLPPSPPSLAEVTRMLADAVESLPNAPGAHDRGQAIGAHARAMTGDSDGDTQQARQSVELALQALQHMRKPAGPKKDREHALRAVPKAIGVHDQYRALAHALVLYSGGQTWQAAGSTLRALVARLSVENDDIARHTIAEALFVVAEDLAALHLDTGDLRDRAQQLTAAAPLDYSAALHEALARAVAALRSYKAGSPAFQTLAADAHEAVERVTRDRPFELQRPATQDALRLITDALVIASPTTKSGP